MRNFALAYSDATAESRVPTIDKAHLDDVTLHDVTREDELAARIGVADADCGCLEPARPREELGRFARALLWIFGDRAPLPLANTRLELVRRFFCATRAGHSPSVTVMSELQRLGLQPIHLAQMADLLN